MSECVFNLQVFTLLFNKGHLYNSGAQSLQQEFLCLRGEESTQRIINANEGTIPILHIRPSTALYSLVRAFPFMFACKTFLQKEDLSGPHYK